MLYRLLCEIPGYPITRSFAESEKLSVIYAKLIEAIAGHYPRISIWCTGASGVGMAAMLYSQLESARDCVEFNIVRKKGEKTHDNLTENDMLRLREQRANFHIFLDDFVSSGTTLRTVLDYVIEYVRQDIKYFDAVFSPTFVGTIFITPAVPRSLILEYLAPAPDDEVVLAKMTGKII